MPCSTLTGIAIDYCREGRGGIENLWILDSADNAITVATPVAGAVPVASITAGGSALDVTLSAFEKYELYKELSNFSEAGTFDSAAGTGFQTTTVNAVFLKMDAAKQAELNQLAKSLRLCIIVKDNQGKFWLVGNDRGAMVTGSASESGTAWNDQNSTTITFTGISPEAMLEVTGITL